MSFLEQRDGDMFVVVNAYCDKLDQWSRIDPKDSKGMRSLTDFLRQCDAASGSITSLGFLNV